MKLSVHDKML